MNLLKEWFSMSDNKFYLLSFGIIFAMLAMPVDRKKIGKDFLLVIISFVVYIICEAVITIIVPTSISANELLLFIGGVAFSIAVGRIIRLYIAWMIKIIAGIIEKIKQVKVYKAKADEEEKPKLEITERQVDN